MKRKLFITTITLAALMLAFNAQAQQGRGFGRGGMGQGLMGCPPQLNLTQDQQKSFNSLRQSFLKDTAVINNEIAQKRLEMDSLFIGSTTDEDKAVKLQREISALQSQYNEKRLSHQLKARKLLTPDQIGQLPSGCNLGFGCGPGSGKGCGHGRGKGCGAGRGQGKFGGNGAGKGRCW
jgi:Spy/CpxP family protein refolding chaperone